MARFPVSKLSAAGRGPEYGAVIRPKLTPVPTYTPPSGGTPIIWGSALLVSPQAGPARPTVYVYGWQTPYTSNPVRHPYPARARPARPADLAPRQVHPPRPQVARPHPPLPTHPP